MKKLFALFMVVAILSQSLVNVGISVYYQVNKTYITQKLCANRNNPKLHCNGHCYLTKLLKQAEEKGNKSAQSIKEKQEIISRNIVACKLLYLPAFKVTKLLLVNSAYRPSGNKTALLKPPIAAIV